MLYVTDKESKILFLVDSGAQMSLLPATSGVKHSCPNKLTLRAVNGTLIHTYGEKCMELDLGLRRTYTHIFMVADVGCIILGADLLQNFWLVDLHGRCLRDRETSLKASGMVKSGIYVPLWLKQARRLLSVNWLKNTPW